MPGPGVGVGVGVGVGSGGGDGGSGSGCVGASVVTFIVTLIDEEPSLFLAVSVKVWLPAEEGAVP